LHIYNNAHLVSLLLAMTINRCFQLMFDALLPGAETERPEWRLGAIGFVISGHSPLMKTRLNLTI